MTTDAHVQIDRARLAALIGEERTRFADEHPRSRALFDEARATLLHGVPMSWMSMWVGGFPLYFEEARGSRITDVDGRTYIDFCLGDTGSMPGHAPAATARAIVDRVQTRGGVTTMLPTADAAWVGGDLARRFGLPLWQFTLTATDANRFILRMCRQITRRPKVLVFSYCYHGTVDETVIVLKDGVPTSKRGNVGPQVDPAQTTRVVEFNDVAALEAELAHGDVACVLMEPWLTNIGIVPAAPGFLEAVRDACDRTGTLLVIDETHTFSAGPGGCTAAFGLRPDIVTIGKSLAGGVPIGGYGVSADVAARIMADEEGDYVDQGGVGGTLAGNALSLAAARATLGEVLTDAAFAHMIELATRYTAGVQEVLDSRRVPWVIVQLGARAEYRFCPTVPRNGGESAAAHDGELDEYMHLALLNRGILMTPFHNMALMSPESTAADVDQHTRTFAEVVDRLIG